MSFAIGSVKSSKDVYFSMANLLILIATDTLLFEATYSQSCQFWKQAEISANKHHKAWVSYKKTQVVFAGEYISQSTWGSRQDFQNWTQSQNVSLASKHTTNCSFEIVSSKRVTC